MWDAFGISPLINFMGVITYHYASTLSSLIYTHNSRYVYTKNKGTVIIPAAGSARAWFPFEKLRVRG
jgi:hypothetical protein